MRKERRNTKGKETEQIHLSSRLTSAIDYARHIHIGRCKGTEIPFYGSFGGSSLPGYG